VFNKGYFEILVRKYYLGDAGYINNDFVLTLYRGIKYYIKKALNLKVKPSYKEELFNLRYTQL
jgi:lipid II:glycine glycyltransferase (peptidoglycan interpeptide bridge formation enzyme)